MRNEELRRQGSAVRKQGNKRERKQGDENKKEVRGENEDVRGRGGEEERKDKDMTKDTRKR